MNSVKIITCDHSARVFFILYFLFSYDKTWHVSEIKKLNGNFFFLLDFSKNIENGGFSL